MISTLLVQKATAAGTVSFSAPVSGEIRAAVGNISAFLSSDPSLSNTEVGTPAADGTRNNILVLITGNQFQGFLPKNAPVISAGETLYLASTGKGSVLFYLDDLT